MRTTQRVLLLNVWVGAGAPFNAGKGNIKNERKILCWHGSKKDNTQVVCLSN
jgi:hypothetical protein